MTRRSQSLIRCALAVPLAASALTLVPAAASAELPLETGFGMGGKLDLAFGRFDAPREPQVTSAPDGDVVAAVVLRQVFGESPDRIVVVRRDADGRPDATFGTDGKAQVDGVDGFLEAVRVLDDGSTVVAGADLGGQAFTARFTRSGTGTFRLWDRPAGCESFSRQDVRPDGKVVVGWWCSAGSDLPGGSRFQVVDPALAAPAAPPAPGPFVPGLSPFELAIDPQGRTLAGSNAYDPDRVRVTRLTPAGVVDTTFGAGGDALAPGGFSALAVDSASRPVVALNGRFSGAPWELVRFTEAGTLDRSFGKDGKVSVEDERLGSGGAQHVVAQPDDRILATGFLKGAVDGAVAVLRLEPDGTPDLTFGPKGILDVTPSRRSGSGPVVATGDGDVVVPLTYRADLGEARSTSVAVGDDSGLVLVRFASTLRPRPVPPVPPVRQEQQRQPDPQPQRQQAVPPPVVVEQPSRSRILRTCVSRRSFTIRLRPRSRVLRSAVVTIAGRRATLSRKGRRLTATVDMRRLRQSTFEVRVVARDNRGRTFRETRRYRTCRVGKGGRPVRGGSTVITVGA